VVQVSAVEFAQLELISGSILCANSHKSWQKAQWKLLAWISLNRYLSGAIREPKPIQLSTGRLAPRLALQRTNSLD